MTSGGERVADVLVRERVPRLFTLCGGHIAPILVAAKARGIRVVDVRDEATAVFAADATARLTGVPGVAAVTAGPGGTNAVTALKNAQQAQSPLVLLGGAPATLLRGRGALQDVDQLELVRSCVGWATSVQRAADLAPALSEAFYRARAGTPGPVFVECPIDLLYDEALVREWYLRGGESKSLGQAAQRWWVRRHVDGLFAGGAGPAEPAPAAEPAPRECPGVVVGLAARLLARAERPVLLVGSQAVGGCGEVSALAEAVARLGVPTWLAGMARGLLGPEHPLQLRHKRGEALREADLVILAGVPADFRLDYGRAIGRRARVIAANLSLGQLFLNRPPTLPAPGHPGLFLRALAARAGAGSLRAGWLEALRARDRAREAEIEAQAAAPAPPVNPLALCQGIERALAPGSVVVADGGDFVATASYVLRPRGPLSWLDPGVFGTLGVGAGFALAAKLARPEADVWLLWGDGACGFGLIELDTLVRHRVPVIAVIGNDAGWTQIARDQVPILGDDVGTVLARSAYERAAEGLGAVGLRLDDPTRIDAVLAEARDLARGGLPVVVNAHIGRTEFRKGSISM